jgi:hypothetical protein
LRVSFTIADNPYLVGNEFEPVFVEGVLLNEIKVAYHEPAVFVNDRTVVVAQHALNATYFIQYVCVVITMIYAFAKSYRNLGISLRFVSTQ